MNAADAFRVLDAERHEIERSLFVDTYCETGEQIRRRLLRAVDDRWEALLKQTANDD